MDDILCRQIDNIACVTSFPVKNVERFDGFYQFFTEDGKMGLLAHGSECGTLNVPQYFARIFDVVLCCYPKRVKELHPDIKIHNEIDWIDKPISVNFIGGNLCTFVKLD